MQGAKAAELKSVRNKAADAVVDFIRFPDQYQFDLLEADAVMQLREDSEFSVLYQLLSTLLQSDNIKVGLQYSSLARMHVVAHTVCCFDDFVGTTSCVCNICCTSVAAVVLGCSITISRISRRAACLCPFC